MRPTQLDHKLFKNIPPHCPKPSEGQVTFHSYLAENIAKHWILFENNERFWDILDAEMVSYEETGLPEKEGIYRFPDPKEIVIGHTEDGYRHLTDSFFLNGYFGEMEMLWQIATNETTKNDLVLPHLQSLLKQMDSNEEAVKETLGKRFLSLLRTIVLLVLCAAIAFGGYWLIGGSFGWDKKVGFPFSLLVGALPLVGWAAMMVAGLGAVYMAFASLVEIFRFFQALLTSGKRNKRAKLYWQAYRKALRYVRLRQLFHRDLTGEDHKTFLDMQRYIEKKAEPYRSQFKW